MADHFTKLRLEARASKVTQSHLAWGIFMIFHVDVMEKHRRHRHINLTSRTLAKTPLRWARSPRCSLYIDTNHQQKQTHIIWWYKLCVMVISICVYVLPSEIPLDRVELSACPRVGLWLSITLSSNRWREPALGKVALLNSTVFILWIKLCGQRAQQGQKT